MRKYCIYFDMSLKELLEEAEEDEMKCVKWKHSRLNIGITCFKTMLLEP